MHRGALRLGFPALALIAATVYASAESKPPLDNLAVVELPAKTLKERGIEARPIGDVVLPTGRIVATDPLVQPDHAALERTVPPGRYPLTIFVAQGRNALAMLRFAPGKFARWRIATVPGQNAATLKDDEIFGYGVDAGVGSFMDPEGVKAMDRRAAQTPKFEDYYNSVLADELTANGADVLLHRPMKDEDVNIAVFSSGWGDGFYASYWGEDEAGTALVLVTDLGVLENGDGRTVQERRIAAMTPEDRVAVGEAHEALKRDDAAALARLLASGRVTPESFAPETGETLALEAVREDKPAALETLARYGAKREVDAETARIFELRTYSDYARSMDRPIEGSKVQLPKRSAALMDVLARWDAGAIPPAPDIPARPAAPPGDKTPAPAAPISGAAPKPSDPSPQPTPN